MKQKKTYILIPLICILTLIVVDPVWATTISDIKKQQQEDQKQLDSAKNNMSGLQDQQDLVDEEIGDMDSALVELMASISMLEDEIADKEAQITVAQADYEKAQADEQAQKTAMERRIKFMYEKGETAYVELFMEAKSLSDMLNKAGYVEKIYEYDRELLITYQDTKKKVEELKNTLEDEKSELEATEFEYKEEQTQLQTQLEEKKKISDNYEVQIAQVKQEAELYKTKIKQQNVQIKKIQEEEAKKAAEEAARKAAEAAKNNPGSTAASSSGSNSASYATIITNATGSALGKEVATYALQFAGNPYVAGGTSLTTGADCSGFTFALYQSYGISIPRTSSEQRNCGTGVDYASAQPGDLICYAGHVAMYIGDGKIIHASSERTGIKVSYATYREILAVRRIV